ncbi:hypothetical protein IW138_001902 [Coemansia sp. RSA 986]|nr:hypothetical protein IW138_001902 [Coemansia sp. RSA 986]
MSDLSLSSLATNSVCESIISMSTPSLDQSAPSLSRKTVNICQPNPPTHRVLKRSRSSAIVEEDISEPQRKMFILHDLSASAIHKRRAPNKKNCHHGNGSDNSSHHTPEKLYESYRPSGSPTRVSGSHVAASVKFTDAGVRDSGKKPKKLIVYACHIALGKHKLTQLLLFYSISPEEEYLHSVSDSAISNSGSSVEDIQNMDMEAKCRRKRKYLFEGSLIQTMHS